MSNDLNASVEKTGPVLILAPGGRDDASARELLALDGVECVSCADLDELTRHLAEGEIEQYGAVLALEEALTKGDLPSLVKLLDAQPPWSDLPFVVLSMANSTGRRLSAKLKLTELLGNLMLLERPIASASLRSAVRSALRGRRRQLQIRRHLQEREEAAALVRDREAMFRAITESMPQIVWATRPDGYHDYYNARWYQFTGVTPGSTDGEDWAGLFHPDDQPEAWRRWLHSLATGDMYEVEYRLRRSDGVWRWQLGRAVPIRDPGTGEILRWLGTCTEIEDQVQARDVLARTREELEALVEDRTRELASTHERLHQAQKMEAVGRLTGGIAHDFNNLLTAVSGSVELIRDRASDPRVLRLAENAFKAAQRGAKLTSQLLAFSRSQRLETAPVDVNALIAGMMDILSRSIEPPVTTRLSLAEGLGLALSDANQLELAVLNLAINSRDAMPEGGTVTISTAISGGTADLKPGRYVAISVSDTGTGMTEDVKSRALEPFFTTKSAGKGTGLGLAQVYGIARQAGGTVAIESAPGQGTTVSILLPAADATEVALSHEPASVPRAVGRLDQSGTVLLVDDDESVRLMLAEFLEQMGWVVLQACDGPQGLELLSRQRPDVCILDYAMPGMNGAELAQAARLVQAGLPIIFATGYAESAVLDAAREGADILRKPFQINELADALGRALQPVA